MHRRTPLSEAVTDRRTQGAGGASRIKKEGREALFQSCDAPFVLAGNAMRQTHATQGSLPAYALRASSASKIPDDFRAVALERDGEKPDGFAIPFHVSVSGGAFCRRHSCCR